MNVAGYVRVSTREQGDSGLGLAHQRGTLATETSRHDGWQLGALVVEVKSTRHRLPELARLLEQLDAGTFDALMVTRMDRFCRSSLDLAVTLDRAKRHGWQLVMLDPPVDTTTPYGEAVAGMAAVWAQLERALISQRTREALAVARARGTFRPGEHLRYDDRNVIGRILTWNTAGVSQSEIARRLQREGTPAPGDGDVWYPRTVGRIIQRENGNARDDV